MRILANRPAKFWVQFEDDDGAPVGADSATQVAVSVTRWDGTVVYSNSACGQDTTPLVGRYVATLPAQSQYDVLTATWTATIGGSTVTIPETLYVVKQRLVSLFALRQDAELATLTGDQLRYAADAAEDECRSALYYSPVPFPERIGLRSVGDLHAFGPVYSGPLSSGPYGGWGGPRLMTHDAYPLSLIAAIRPDGVALTTQELAQISAREGWFEWSDYRNWDPGEWQVWMVHGRWQAPPEDLRRAVTKRTRYLARYLAGHDELPERASQVATEGGTMLLAYPKLDAPTGMPEVDVVYARYRLPGL